MSQRSGAFSLWTRGEGRPSLQRSVTTPFSGDWFTQLFGFKEGKYEDTQQRLQLKPGPDGRHTIEGENGRVYKVGRFWTPSLAELEEEASRKGGMQALAGKLRVRNVLGDVSGKHAEAENLHATFQVASQFNCLEFVGPNVKPEHGITGYMNDRTQGPACSITCGPATAYRNYFAEVDGAIGQRADRQIDNLRDVSAKIGNVPDGRYYRVIGGYTMAETEGLRRMSKHMNSLSKEQFNEIRRSLRIGVQEDVQVTATNWGRNQLKHDDHTVTQVFGSACSVSYSRNSPDVWAPFGRMVLSASYEATLWVTLLSALRHGGNDPKLKTCPGPRRVYLTCLGGGVFGNPMEWITDAMEEAFSKFENVDLEVCIVTYAGSIDRGLLELEKRYAGPCTPL